MRRLNQRLNAPLVPLADTSITQASVQGQKDTLRVVEGSIRSSLGQSQPPAAASAYEGEQLSGAGSSSDGQPRSQIPRWLPPPPTPFAAAAAKPSHLQPTTPFQPVASAEPPPHLVLLSATPEHNLARLRWHSAQYAMQQLQVEAEKLRDAVNALLPLLLQPPRRG